MRNACKILVTNPEGKRVLQRPRRRFEDDDKIKIKEVRRERMECIYLAQNREQWRSLESTAKSIPVP
jgi:hypothetical protein